MDSNKLKVFRTNPIPPAMFPTSVDDNFILLVVLAQNPSYSWCHFSITCITFNPSGNPVSSTLNMSRTLSLLPPLVLVQFATISSLDYFNSLLTGHTAFVLVPYSLFLCPLLCLLWDCWACRRYSVFIFWLISLTVLATLSPQPTSLWKCTTDPLTASSFRVCCES